LKKIIFFGLVLILLFSFSGIVYASCNIGIQPSACNGEYVDITVNGTFYVNMLDWGGNPNSWYTNCLLDGARDYTIDINLYEKDWSSGDDDIDGWSGIFTTTKWPEEGQCAQIYFQHLFEDIKLSDWVGGVEGDTVEIYANCEGFPENELITSNYKSLTKDVDIIYGQCGDGPCCDISTCEYKSTTEICEHNVNIDYGCPWGTSSGDDVGIRYQDRYCGGLSRNCNGSLKWGEWSVKDYCGSVEACVDGSSSCENVVCSDDNDCPNDGWYGSTWCNEDNVIQEYRNYFCRYPGTGSSSCEYSMSYKIKQSCENGCFNGVCAVCDSDSDCGKDGWVGNPSCNTGDVYQNYRTYTCSDPRADSASCEFSDDFQLKYDCTDTCSGGQCIGIECYSNSDCGTDGYVGSTWCSGGDVWQNFRQYVCSNPGTSSADCMYSDSGMMKTDCNDGCSGGYCVDIECSSDSDCGADGWLENEYCSGGDVWDTKREYTCSDPGTASSSCSYVDNDMIKQGCIVECIDGSCNDIECYSNSDCGTDGWGTIQRCSDSHDVEQFYYIYICDNPGTIDSKCNSTYEYRTLINCTNGCTSNWPNASCANITCYSDEDCGEYSCSNNLFCDDNDIYRQCSDYHCNFPGREDSYCSRIFPMEYIETCPKYCKDGECVNCTSNSHCTDLNKSMCVNNVCVECVDSYDCIWGEQLCIDNNCVDFECGSDYDCGEDRYIGEPFCRGENIDRTYETSICINPWELDSYCIYNYTNRTIYECENGCLNATCIDPSNSSMNIVRYSGITGFNGYVKAYDGDFIIDVLAYIEGDGNITPDQVRIFGDDFNTVCGEKNCSPTSGNYFLCHCNDFLIEFDKFKAKFNFSLHLNNGTMVEFEQVDMVSDGVDPVIEINESPKWINDSVMIKYKIKDAAVNLNDYSVCSGIQRIEFWDGAVKLDETVLNTTDCIFSEYKKLPIPSSNNITLYAYDIVNNSNSVVSDDYEPVCSIDSDCGGAHEYILPQFCGGVNNDIVCINYRTWTCYNPGTAFAYCNYTLTPDTIGAAPCSTFDKICYNGSCIDCLTDNDCGETGFIEDPYCSDGNLWQIYRTWNCNNSGTYDSNCNYFDEIVLKQNCSGSCNDGSCENISCFIDSDCGKDGWVEGIYCNGKNVAQLYREYNCENPGTVNSLCSYSEKEIIKENCTISCEKGSCINESYLWGTNLYSKEIYKFNKEGNLLDKIESPGNFTSHSTQGITWDGEYLWVVNGNTNKIYKITTSGEIVKSFDSPGGTRGLTWDGEYLWKSDSSSDKIYKITTSGEIVKSFDSPGEAMGLTWDGEYLWFVDYYDDKIYKITTSGEIVKSFDSPGNSPDGLAWDGEYLWNSDRIGDNANKIFKLTKNGTLVDTLITELDSRKIVWQIQTDSIECFSDSDCGEDHYIEDRYCLDENVWQTYREYDCIYAGTISSSCSYSEEDKKRKDCEYGCEQGICIENPDSNYTCSDDIECGEDGWVDDPLCKSGNVYQKFRTWKCNNPSTFDAYCKYNDTILLKEECNGTCLDGLCVIDVCINDSDCGTDKYIGNPYCLEGDVYQVYRTWSCDVPGMDSCSYTDNIQIKNNCSVGCLDGICVYEDDEGDGNFDLKISYFVVQHPDNPTAGNPVTLAFNLENKGNLSVDETEWVLETGSGTIIKGVVTDLNSGEGRIIARKVTYADTGDYYAKVKVDPNKKINEFDEQNNKEELIISIN